MKSFFEKISALPQERMAPILAPKDKDIASVSAGTFSFGVKNGALCLLSGSGDVLVRSVGIWRDTEFVNSPFSLSAAGNELTVLSKTDKEVLQLSIVPSADGLAFDIILKIDAAEQTSVLRDAIVFDVEIPLNWASRPNGVLIRTDNPSPTWLGRGSAIFGSNHLSFGIVGPTAASSLQYDPRINRLWINLDFAYDHPHVIPAEDANWNDRSSITYDAGSTRSMTIRIELAAAQSAIPRLLLGPSGALATFIWTEHACHCDLRTHRAVYFGDEEIVSANKATAGFVKHRIPVTKSVFFANTESEMNWVREAVIDGPMVAIQGNPEFLDYLKELHSTGIFEIVPHGIQPQTSNRSLFEAAVAFMRSNFDSVSWIDHSTFRRNWISGGRDSYLAFGCSRGGADYRGDIWRDKGFRYFWNHALEFFERIPIQNETEAPPTKASSVITLFKHALKRTLTSLAPTLWQRLKEKGNSGNQIDVSLDQFSVPNDWPFPHWWRNPTATEDFINWSTRSTPAAYFRLGEGDLMRRRLAGLVANWGLDVHHSYPTRVEAGNATWIRTPDGHFIINPEFDAVLSEMARLRDSGTLYVATVRDAVSRWIALDQIRLRKQDAGKIEIQNSGTETIFGATFAIRGKVPLVDGVAPPSKRVDEDTIFWIDLPAHSRIVLTQLN